LGALDPTTFAVCPLEPEARLAARKVSHLAEARHTVGITVDIAGQLAALLLLAAALLRPRPSAMIAAPPHLAIGLDGDAEHPGGAMFLAGASRRAMRARGVVAAGRGARELDSLLR